MLTLNLKVTFLEHSKQLDLFLFSMHDFYVYLQAEATYAEASPP